jgi:adenylylsulfate kinase
MPGMSNENNLTYHASTVSPEDRERLLGQQGRVLWFTGLSGSGKSTLANATEAVLHASGRATFLLDGDNVRLGLNRDLGFSADDRTENIRRIAEVAKLMADAGLVVLTAFVSPYAVDRAAAREIVGAGRFVEVFVDTPLAECERRDPKGLYAKARAGQIADFTGISAPFEVPQSPEIHLHPAEQSVSDCVEYVVRTLSLS